MLLSSHIPGATGWCLWPVCASPTHLLPSCQKQPCLPLSLNHPTLPWRVAQPRFHFLSTTFSFCGTAQYLGHKYTGGSLIKSICPGPLPAAFIMWPKALVVAHPAPKAAPAKPIAFLGLPSKSTCPYQGERCRMRQGCCTMSLPWRASPSFTGYICMESQEEMAVIRPRQHSLAPLLMICVQENLHSLT